MTTGKKILMIDDDVNLVNVFRLVCEAKGYHFSAAYSAREGLQKIRDVEPDLIILDMSMPGMGGVGFLKEISSADGTPRHPVLVLTAHAQEEYRLEAVAPGGKAGSQLALIVVMS